MKKVMTQREIDAQARANRVATPPAHTPVKAVKKTPSTVPMPAKSTLEAKWDGMAAGDRKAVVRATGAFPGVVGKTWAEMSEKVRARLVPALEGKVKPTGEKVVPAKVRKTGKTEAEGTYDNQPETMFVTTSIIQLDVAYKAMLGSGLAVKRVCVPTGMFGLQIPKKDWKKASELLEAALDQ